MPRPHRATTTSAPTTQPPQGEATPPADLTPAERQRAHLTRISRLGAEASRAAKAARVGEVARIPLSRHADRLRYEAVALADLILSDIKRLRKDTKNGEVVRKLVLEFGLLYDKITARSLDSAGTIHIPDKVLIMLRELFAGQLRQNAATSGSAQNSTLPLPEPPLPPEPPSPESIVVHAPAADRAS